MLRDFCLARLLGAVWAMLLDGCAAGRCQLMRCAGAAHCHAVRTLAAAAAKSQPCSACKESGQRPSFACAVSRCNKPHGLKHQQPTWGCQEVWCLVGVEWVQALSWADCSGGPVVSTSLAHEAWVLCMCLQQMHGCSDTTKLAWAAVRSPSG